MGKENAVMPHGATHRQQAATRTIGPVDWVDEIEQSPEPQPDVVGLGEILRGEIELKTSTQGGSPAVIRVPHSILAVLVTVGLAMVGAGFWVVSSVTEMKTNLAVIQQNQREAKATYSGNLRLMVAYSTNETNRVEFMKGLLTTAQQHQVFEWEKSNPKPKLPSTDMEDDKEINQ